MNKFTMTQARFMSGIYSSDSEMEQDLKLWHWLGQRRYIIVDQEPTSVDPDVEVVIVRDRPADA